MERLDEEARRAVIDRVKADVANRLRSVCADLSDEEFDELVEHVATVNVKYAYRRTDDLFPMRDRR